MERVSLGLRHFLFEQDDTLRHVPQRVMRGLMFGIDRMPQYSGQSLRAATVLLHLENKKPVSIAEVEASIWYFDATGRIDAGLRRSAIEAWSTHDAVKAMDTSGPVVNLTPRLMREKWRGRYRWEPTPAQVTTIVHAIWPESAGKPVERPKFATGVRKRRPPMTYEAKQAERECASKFSTIAYKMSDLKLNSVKALIALAEERATTEEPIFRELWSGVVAAAERRLAIVRARKSNKGTWYAIAEATTWKDPPHGTGRVHELEHVKCDGRQAAILAGRELLKKHAEHFSDYTTIDVRVFPEIEENPVAEPVD